MTQKPGATPPAGITLADVYYIIFRWKWLILFAAVGGLIGAGFAYFCYPYTYISEAKLLVRYVIDTSPTDNLTGETQIRPSQQAATILNSEIEILSSRDLAMMAADAVGPAKVLGKPTSTNRYAAGAKIWKDLKCGVVQNSDVIYLEFASQNRDVPQAVLEQLLLDYTNRHREIHLRPGVSEESIEQLSDLTRNRLEDVEKQLHDQLTKLGVLSVDEARTAFQQEVTQLRQEISISEADLVEHEATMQELKLRLPEDSGASNNVVATNVESVAPAIVEAYADASQNVVHLQALLDDQLLHLTTNSSVVQGTMTNLALARGVKRKMESEHPRLLAMSAQAVGRVGATGPTTQDLVNSEDIKVKSLVAKINLLTNALSEVESNVALINNAGTSITDLQRTRDIAEAEYRRLEQSLDQARIAAALGPGHVSNISVVEQPTQPLAEAKTRMPMTYGFLFGGVGLGLGLAFLIEMYFIRTIKRPSEIEPILGAPCFISIPRVNGRAREHHGAQATALLPAANGEENGVPELPGMEVAVRAALPAPENPHALAPFHETLRDRLVAFFEMVNLTHKPKLVAVTSCKEGAGVSTVAAGLAASLSETGEGNVLLVNMNGENGEAHHFFKGKLACDLDDVLQKEKPADSRIQDNLYVAREGEKNRSLPRVLPKRFNNLVVRMKTSDFDYIIFDMPPISQISITPRLARFMDMVLMVVESQKTDREMAKKAATLLTESKTHVGVVLNKHRSYVPKSLCQEI